MRTDRGEMIDDANTLIRLLEMIHFHGLVSEEPRAQELLAAWKQQYQTLQAEYEEIEQDALQEGHRGFFCTQCGARTRVVTPRPGAAWEHECTRLTCGYHLYYVRGSRGMLKGDRGSA